MGSERVRQRRVSKFDKMIAENEVDILKQKLRNHKPPFQVPMDKDTFRRLWKAVHPVNAKGAKDWMMVDQQYDIIDVDNDENVTVEEMLSHLGQLEPLTRVRSIDPKSWSQWVGAFVGMGPPPNREVIAYRSLSAFIVLISIVNLMAETLPEYYNHADNHFGTDFTFVVDIFCNAWFTLELIAWLITYEHPKNPEQNKHKVFFAFETWIDITSIVPFYLELILRSAAESSRPLQILRFWRIVRSISIATRVTQRKVGKGTVWGKVHRFLVSWCWLSLVLLPAVVCSASFIFFVERNQATFNTTSEIWFRNPDSSYDDAGSPLLYQSVNDAVWWALVTLTTVGYGDLFPITPVGKLIGAMVMLFGIIVLAYPIAIIGSVDDEAAEEEIAKRQSLLFYQGIRNWIDDIGEDENVMSPRGSSGHITAKSYPRWAHDLNESINRKLDDLGDALDSVSNRIDDLDAS